MSTQENINKPKLELIKASDIEPKEIKWLWYPFVPFGKVTLVQGDPGDGKSTFMLTVAALLTRGEPLPFSDNADAYEPMNVIYQTTFRTPGSIDIVGAVRSSLLIGKSKENEDERILVQQKANLAPTGAAIVFSVGENGVTFIRETEQNADELLSEFSQSIGRPDVKTQQAMDIIKGILSDGKEHEATECEAKLSESGISLSTAKKAKRLLGVQSYKPHFAWYWKLPDCD